MVGTVGVSIGDPAGIGPEVLDKALRLLAGRIPQVITLRLFGPAPILSDLVESHGGRDGSFEIEPVVTTPDLKGVCVGRYTAASGAASFAALRAAVSELASGATDSLVTGPISKMAFSDAGQDWPGQTEFVADALDCREFVMMLGGPALKVALVTTHLALRDVPDAVTADRVLSCIRVCHRFVRDTLGRAVPKIAVAAMNPHCGEGGRFGSEESLVLGPAVRAAFSEGIDVTGPIAADTVYKMAFDGRFDMVLSMYHDQGLAPLKLVHFSDAINVTMGLPRVRCSPDHGPAWDIAGKGVADPTSMVNAILFASGLSRD